VENERGKVTEQIEGIFRNLHHVCIVVKNIEDAVKYYESIGVGPWGDYPPLSMYSSVSLPREDFETLRYKWCDLDNVQIQLCEPGDAPTPQRKFLEEKGEGVYHLGFHVEDVDAGERSGQGMGLDVLAKGRRPGGGGFTYFDTRSDAGVVLEIRSVPPFS
jgi:methylmalonyl-CoA/ethylmalonyl-CoA epimerase